MSLDLGTPAEPTGPAPADPPDRAARPSGDIAPAPVRGRHTARWVAATVLVVAAGLIAVLATRPPASTVEARSPLLNRVAPPVGGATVDGSRFVLPRVPGHYVVLNFFASWCTPCQIETPELVAFEFQHRARGDASVVSVVFNDTIPAARRYQAQVGVTWPTLADAGGGLALSYGVRENPTSFVISPTGRVVAVVLGGVTAAGLDRIVALGEASGYGR